MKATLIFSSENLRPGMPLSVFSLISRSVISYRMAARQPYALKESEEIGNIE
jgi:hypothetical protein